MHKKKTGAYLPDEYMLCCFLKKCKYYRQSFGILLSNRNDISNCLYERMPQLLLHLSLT